MLARSLEVASIRAAAIRPAVALPLSDIGSHAGAHSGESAWKRVIADFTVAPIIEHRRPDEGGAA